MRIRWIGCNSAIEKQHNTFEALSISRVQYYPHKFAKTESPAVGFPRRGLGNCSREIPISPLVVSGGVAQPL